MQTQENLGLSVFYYAHFRINKPDLDALLAAEPYQPIPQGQPLPDYSTLNLAKWWTPQALGPDLKAYEYEKPDPQDKDESLWGKRLYQNAQANEFYLIKGYGY